LNLAVELAHGPAGTLSLGFIETSGVPFFSASKRT
jgi:hypothetical protein